VKEISLHEDFEASYRTCLQWLNDIQKMSSEFSDGSYEDRYKIEEAQHKFQVCLKSPSFIKLDYELADCLN